MNIHARIQVFLMLFSAGMALAHSIAGEPVWACAQALCSAYWMFRIWGCLRSAA